MSADAYAEFGRDELIEEVEACRRILARVALHLRQGEISEALAEIPVTEHELLAEQVLGSDVPPRGGRP